MSNPHQERLNHLLDRFINAKLSRSEYEELVDLINLAEDADIKAHAKKLLDKGNNALSEDFVNTRISSLHSRLSKKIHVNNQEELKKTAISRIRPWWYWAAAASILAVGIFGYLKIQQQPVIDQSTAHVLEDLDPGSNKASIILDGQEYDLDESKQGLILSQNSISYDDGALVIDNVLSGKSVKIVTPYGGQYHLSLSDGTKVWLNAGSELSYTGDYGKSNRTINLSGEAYFEVSKNKDLPFIVRNPKQEIQVLGTHFNVNAYPDEGINKTTLREGSLRVSTASGKKLLVPNQQAQFDVQGNSLKTVAVDAEAVIAWKNGIIDLHGLSLQECMRQLSRWYDVEIVYLNHIPEIEMGGRMSRGLKLSTFLQFLKTNFNIATELTADRKLKVKLMES